MTFIEMQERIDVEDKHIEDFETIEEGENERREKSTGKDAGECEGRS